MKILSFVLCFLLVFQTTVFAAGKSVTLKKNQKVPFPGTLLDAEAIAEILAKTKKLKEELKIKLTQQKEKLKIQHDMKYNLLKVDISALQKRSDEIIKLKNEELTRLQKMVFKPKRDLTILWFTIGVAIGVGSTIGIAFAIKEVTK